MITYFLIISLFKLIFTIDFPETDLNCPTFENIYGNHIFYKNTFHQFHKKQGHSSKITTINYINGSAIYVSGDSAGRLLINDLRSGETIQYFDLYTTDPEGIQSISSTKNGDVLVISKIEIKIYNIYEGNTIFSTSITSDQLNQLTITLIYQERNTCVIKTYALPLYDSKQKQTIYQLLCVYVDLINGVTQLRYINSRYELEVKLTMNISTSQQPAKQGKSNQPSNFVIVEYVSGITTFSDSIHILLGISTSNTIYAQQVPKETKKQDEDVFTWNPTNLPQVVNSYMHLKKTSIIAIVYGYDSKSPPNGSNIQNCICFYDLTSLEYDSSTKQFSLQKMITTPKANIPLQSNNLIQDMVNINQDDNNSYFAFIYQNKQIVIYSTTYLINNSFNLGGAIYLTFSSAISKAHGITMTGVPRLIVGFSSGSVSSFDFSNSITSSTQNSKEVSISTFNFSQASQNLQQTVSGFYYDESNQILNLIGKNVLNKDSVSVSAQQYNFNSHSSSNSTFTFSSSESVSTIIINTSKYFSIQIAKGSAYIQKVNNVCPTQNSGQNPVQIPTYTITVNNGQSTFTSTINLTSSNQYVKGLLSQQSFYFNSDYQVAVAFAIQSFIYSDYCVQTQQNGQNPPPGRRQLQETQAQSYDIYLFIYNMKANIVFQSSKAINTVSTLDSFIKMDIDSYQNIVLLFQDQTITLKPYLDNQKIKLYTTNTKIDTLSNYLSNQIQNITSTISSLKQLYFISSLNKFILQFQMKSNNNQICTSFLSYSQDWTTTLNTKFLSFVISANDEDDQPYLISQLSYISDFQLIVCQVSDKLRIYKYNSDSSLSLYLIFNREDWNQAYFFFPLKLQGTNFLIIIEANAVIKKINLKSCSSSTCINKKCEQSTYIKQLTGSTVSDILNYDTYGYNLRSEVLSISKLKLFNSIQTFTKLSINYSIYFQKLSNIIWNNYYAILEDDETYQDFLKKNQINLTIQSVDQEKSNPKTTSDVFSLTSSETLDYTVYQYIQLINIKWIITKSIPFFEIDNQYFLLNNLIFSYDKSINIPYFIQTADTAVDIKGLQIINTVIQDYNFINTAAIIQVNIKVDTYQVVFDNIIIKNNIFNSTNFLYSQNLINLVFTNSIIESNTMKYSPMSSLDVSFITAQNISLKSVNISSNYLQNACFFISIHFLKQKELNSYQDAIKWDILDLNLLDNSYFTFLATISSFVLDAQTAFIGIYKTSFSLTNSSFIRTKNYNCQYSDYQLNKCSTSSSSKFQMFSLQNVMKSTLDGIKDIDNQLSFLSQSSGNSANVNDYNCSNTQISQQIDNSCLIFKDYAIFNLILNKCSFYNKTLQNSYLIRIQQDTLNVGADQNGGTVSLQNLYFDTHVLTTQSSFYKSSIIYIESLKNIDIQLNSLTFTSISFSTPQRLFYGQGSCILMESPFSSFKIENSFVKKMLSYSPSSAFYLNVDNGSIKSCSFSNNNYALTSSKFEGGFVEVQTNKFSVLLSNFTEGTSKQGAAFTLVPSSSNSLYNFTNCIFQNLLTSQNGGVVLMNEALNSSQIIFNSCSFKNLVSQKGSGIYVQYSLAVKDKTQFENVFPHITFNDCNSTDIFAVQGGLIYSINSQVAINNLKTYSNNPNQIQQFPMKVEEQINGIESIGEFISLYSSISTINKLQLSNHQVFTTNIESNQQNTVILSAYSKSRVEINESVIDNCLFSQNGLIQIETSSLKMTNTNITLSNDFNQISRRLETNINQEIQLKYSAIIIKSLSDIDFYKVIMKTIKCLNSLCSGGALIIMNSSGIISDSQFLDNTSEKNGGSLSILNLSGQLNIINSSFKGSQSLSGNGGAISFITDQNTYDLVINDSFVISNQAKQGGGIYFEFQKNPNANKYISSLIKTSVLLNKAAVLGGGIYYQGQAPYISDASLISNNTADSSFGQNSFSYPKQIVLNEKLSLSTSNFTFSTYTLATGVVVYKIQKQVSGTALPDLIFQLVDENGSVLDKSYSTQGNEVTLKLTKNQDLSKNDFTITSQISSYAFTDYFNVTSFIITGTPGTSVFLSLSSESVQNSSFSQYIIVLEIELRSCIRGEIFQKVVETLNSVSKTFYKCVNCLQGTYSLTYPDLSNPIEECSKCNSNAFCQGGDVIEVNSGYWRINDQTDEIISCSNAASNCLGGTSNSTCSEGHIGPLCESCDIKNDYTTAGNFQCADCGNQLTNSLKIIGLMIFYILSAKLSVDGVLQKLLNMQKFRAHMNLQQLEQAEQNTSILLKLILNYFQIIMVLTTFQINIPVSINGSVDVIANPTTQILYSFECFFYYLSLQTGINMIYIQIISSVLLPIICLLIFLISGTINYRKDPQTRSFYLHTSFLYCLMYFQPSIFKNAISVISCRKIGQIKYIQYNVLFECYTDQYMVWSFGLVIPIIIVVAVLIPSILALLINRSIKSKIIKNKQKYAFMIGEYKNVAWFWEFIKMNVKLLIMCCLIFYEYDVPNKILFIFFIVCFYGFLLFYFKPYKEKIYNKVDILQTFVQGVSVYLGFVAYQNYSQMFWWFLSILTIAALNTVFIVWSFKLLAFAYIQKAKGDLDKLKLYLAKFLCCRKYFFSKKSRKYYSLQRWKKSIIKLLHSKNLINQWTGKLKVDKDTVFPILFGEQSPEIVKKVKKEHQQNSYVKIQVQDLKNEKANGDLILSMEKYDDDQTQCQNIDILSNKSKSIHKKLFKNQKQNSIFENDNGKVGSNQLPSDRDQPIHDTNEIIDINKQYKNFNNRNSNSDNALEQEIISERQLNECVNIQPQQRYLGESSPSMFLSQNNFFKSKQKPKANDDQLDIVSLKTKQKSIKKNQQNDDNI